MTVLLRLLKSCEKAMVNNECVEPGLLTHKDILHQRNWDTHCFIELFLVDKANRLDYLRDMLDKMNKRRVRKGIAAKMPIGHYFQSWVYGCEGIPDDIKSRCLLTRSPRGAAMFCPAVRKRIIAENRTADFSYITYRYPSFDAQDWLDFRFKVGSEEHVQAFIKLLDDYKMWPSFNRHGSISDAISRFVFSDTRIGDMYLDKLMPAFEQSVHVKDYTVNSSTMDTILAVFKMSLPTDFDKLLSFFNSVNVITHSHAGRDGLTMPDYMSRAVAGIVTAAGKGREDDVATFMAERTLVFTSKPPRPICFTNAR